MHIKVLFEQRMQLAVLAYKSKSVNKSGCDYLSRIGIKEHFWILVIVQNITGILVTKYSLLISI